MLYVLPSDLLYFPGIVEIAQLSWPENQQAIPELLEATILQQSRIAWTAEEQAAADDALVMLQAACESGSAEADSYLTNIAVPVPTPRVLQDKVRDLVRYFLYARIATEDIIRVRKEAIAWFKALAAGQISLSSSISTSGIAYSQPDPVFTQWNGDDQCII